MLRLRLTCVLLVLVSASAAAQPRAGSEPAPDVLVSIPDTAAPPEWELRIPVSIKPAASVGASRMTFRVVYPSPTLAYEGIKPTEQIEGAGFTVKVDAPVITGDTASVSVELSPAKTSTATLRSGVAFILILRVSEDAEEKDYAITVEDVKATSAAPASAELRAASERKAMFMVAPPGLPIFACYFYMH